MAPTPEDRSLTSKVHLCKLCGRVRAAALSAIHRDYLWDWL